MAVKFQQCEVCQAGGYIAADAIRGLAIPVRRCVDCRAEGAVPVQVVVEHIVEIGGIKNADDQWLDIIDDTLARLELSQKEFEEMVVAEAEAAGIDVEWNR